MLRDVIIRPIVSEKTYALADTGDGARPATYTFQVATNANKVSVRQAVEEIFNVKVNSVNILNRAGKRKRNRGQRTFGRRSDVKRAYVTLALGETIPLFEN